MCLYAIEPARESRCSINIPVRRPPDALVYCSKSSGDDAKGRTICVYVSYMCRGETGSEEEGGEGRPSDTEGFAVLLSKTSDQRPRLRVGTKLKMHQWLVYFKPRLKTC